MLSLSRINQGHCIRLPAPLIPTSTGAPAVYDEPLLVLSSFAFVIRAEMRLTRSLWTATTAVRSAHSSLHRCSATTISPIVRHYSLSSSSVSSCDFSYQPRTIDVPRPSAAESSNRLPLLDSAMMRPSSAPTSLFTLLSSPTALASLSLSNPTSPPPSAPDLPPPYPSSSPSTGVVPQPAIDCPATISSLVPLLCHLTYKPNVLKRKRTHGFLARKEAKGGRKVLARRWIKGRKRLAA